ncbi:hypothetical protein [Pseudoxanthomonas sp.]|uniref:hypothetical protein n=1 Tax=Pseudoxanthomonas sp. TaxID=1871049 RepID=UPI0026322533|nr:hypothetical protein [Pseudoxanthomonas sp.]WDS35982.1 MAG: hypothetical protein O8I58_17025 [Pseudoxanthomonas sp.]
MSMLTSLSMQRVTDEDPVVFDNEERYRRFRESLPVLLGNTLFSFSDIPEQPRQENTMLALQH